MEGEVAIVDCCAKSFRCPREKNCTTSRLWDRINRTIIGILRDTTLQSLLRKAGA
jgi:DNA-binding IscR family transcriptional regulator